MDIDEKYTIIELCGHSFNNDVRLYITTDDDIIKNYVVNIHDLSSCIPDIIEYINSNCIFIYLNL